MPLARRTAGLTCIKVLRVTFEILVHAAARTVHSIHFGLRMRNFNAEAIP